MSRKQGKDLQDQDIVPGYGQAAGIFFMVGAPIMLQMFLSYIQVTINYIFITAYDDPILLGALGLGLYFYACFYVTLYIGMNQAMITFGSQLKGMGKVREIGLYLNAGRMIVILLAIPITILLMSSYDILIALGQDTSLAYQSSQFLKGLSPSVVIYGFSCLHEQFLMSQRKIAPGLISNFMACIVQFILNIFMIWKWDLGMWGAGMSVTITNTVQSSFFIFLLWWYEDLRGTQFWPSFNSEQWSYFKSYLHLGIPSMLMAFLEIGGVECFQPLSGLISTSANGAQSIVMNIYACMFTLYVGASIAAGIFVGSSIGENKIKSARRFAFVSELCIVSFTTTFATILFTFRESIVSKFTSDAEIHAIAVPAMAVLCFALIPDSLIFAQVGILRGLGKQKLAASIQILSIFLISIPLGCFLVFVCGFNVAGFWIGFLVRCVLAAAVFAYIIWRHLDWEVIAQETFERERQLKKSNEEASQYGAVPQNDEKFEIN